MTDAEQWNRDEQSRRETTRRQQEHEAHPLSCACRQCGRDQLDRNDRW